jgi:sec-independent protein translocase protein TatC
MSNGKSTAMIDPEDMFADTRMSFGDHLEDLRVHLWRAVKSFLICMVLSLFIGNYVVAFIAAPVEKQLRAYNARLADKEVARITAEAEAGTLEMRSSKVEWWVNRNQLRKSVGLEPLPEPALGATIHFFEDWLEKLDIDDWIDRKLVAQESGWVPITMQTADPRLKDLMIRSSNWRGNTLKTFNITEAFFVYFKVSMITGVIMASPWIFYHIWSFIAAGLYPHEKKYVNVYLPFSLGLFLAGAAVCQFLVIPKAIEVLLSFNEWMGLEPDLRLNEWLSFAMMMPLIFGISFQTPLVMMFMTKIGVADASTFRSYWKIAYFAMAVFAAVITPTVDAVSMLFLWVPMVLLYELGIWLCKLQPQTPFEDVETPEAEEMVEV